ncbi:hypothetical protein FRUB_00386 [Fimbriiglobus ruber]|uniref:Uncharacterized protein n=1 Tax=Fimbriiglobus ruber TaxID=1908690 RepID=A0A225EEG2_9BACT|nr:hypothetical protein FRUB_00386 [Fimbriiglobus ruber]
MGLVGVPGSGRSATPELLSLVPKEAGFVVVVENPRKLVESVRKHELYQSAQALPQVREALDSTVARRFFQLITYYERDLGAKWPDLLDKIAGGGIVVGSAVDADPTPALLVVRGTDESVSAEFYTRALSVLEQEVARQSGATGEQKLRRVTENGVETSHLGKEFHSARVGSVIYVANQEVALKAGLALSNKGKSGASAADLPGPKAARKLLGGDPLVWTWLDFAKIKERQATKDFFSSTRKDFTQTLLFGSTADAFRRADFVAAALYKTDSGFRGIVRIPAKRADLPKEFALHAPTPDQPGSLPLLEPKGVVYSQSFYLDLGALWTQRKQLINEQQLKDIEKGERDVSRVLPGTTLGKLFEMSGPYHRVVVAHRDEKLYGVTPDQQIPPFALVTSMRDPQFGKTAVAAMRAGALLASVQYGLKMADEVHDDVTITTYRFPETGEYPGRGDPGKLRFNFVPSFAVVGEFLVVSSTPGLIKDLIPELRKTATPGDRSSSVWRARGYAPGTAATLRDNPEPVVTTTVLTQGIGLSEAKKQVEQIADFVATLGAIGLEIDHQTDTFQIQFEWKKK